METILVATKHVNCKWISVLCLWAIWYRSQRHWHLLMQDKLACVCGGVEQWHIFRVSSTGPASLALTRLLNTLSSIAGKFYLSLKTPQSFK